MPCVTGQSLLRPGGKATWYKSLVHFPEIEYTSHAHVPFINRLQTSLSGSFLCYSISAHKPQLYQRIPSWRPHTFASLVVFIKSLFISPPHPNLPVLFSCSGTRIFQIPENFLFALQWSGEGDEKAASKQQGSGTCTAEKCARARSKIPAVNPSKNGGRKWHRPDRFSTKKKKKGERKHISEPCKYILIGHGVKRCL